MFYKNVDWFLVLKFDNFYPLVLRRISLLIIVSKTLNT